MKKYIIAFGLSLVLVGCSFGPFSKTEETNKPLPKPAVKIDTQVEVGNFYFNAGGDGLTLLNTDDDDFSVKLSDKEIGEANIVDGILTFTELLDEGENVQVINLKAYVESLK